LQRPARLPSRAFGRVIDDVGPLPELLEDAWAQALPEREAAAQNEVLRAAPDLNQFPPSGRP